MKLFSNYFLSSNIYITLAFLSLWIYYALKLDLNFSLLQAICLSSSTYISYNLLRYIPFKKNHYIKPELAFYYQNHSIFFIITNLIAGVTFVLTISSLTYFQITLVTLLGALTIFYERILIGYHLRSIPFFKSFLISIIWACLCVLIHYEVSQDMTKLLKNFIECLIFIFLLCLMLDFRDREEDKFTGTKTFSLILSPKNSLYFCLALFSLFQLYDFQVFKSVISIFLSTMAMSFSFKDKISYYQYIFLIDGLIFIHTWRMINF